MQVFGLKVESLKFKDELDNFFLFFFWWFREKAVPLQPIL